MANENCLVTKLPGTSTGDHETFTGITIRFDKNRETAWRTRDVYLSRVNAYSRLEASFNKGPQDSYLGIYAKNLTAYYCLNDQWKDVHNRQVSSSSLKFYVNSKESIDSGYDYGDIIITNKYPIQAIAIPYNAVVPSIHGMRSLDSLIYLQINCPGKCVDLDELYFPNLKGVDIVAKDQSRSKVERFLNRHKNLVYVKISGTSVVTEEQQNVYYEDNTKVLKYDGYYNTDLIQSLKCPDSVKWFVTRPTSVDCLPVNCIYTWLSSGFYGNLEDFVKRAFDAGRTSGMLFFRATGSTLAPAATNVKFKNVSISEWLARWAITSKDRNGNNITDTNGNLCTYIKPDMDTNSKGEPYVKQYLSTGNGDCIILHWKVQDGAEPVWENVEMLLQLGKSTGRFDFIPTDNAIKTGSSNRLNQVTNYNEDGNYIPSTTPDEPDPLNQVTPIDSNPDPLDTNTMGDTNDSTDNPEVEDPVDGNNE